MTTKVIYRMSGCSVVQSIMEGGYQIFTIICGDHAVAEFKTRRAAINYLAKEFVVPEYRKHR